MSAEPGFRNSPEQLYQILQKAPPFFPLRTFKGIFRYFNQIGLRCLGASFFMIRQMTATTVAPACRSSLRPAYSLDRIRHIRTSEYPRKMKIDFIPLREYHYILNTCNRGYATQ